MISVILYIAIIVRICQFCLFRLVSNFIKFVVESFIELQEFTKQRMPKLWFWNGNKFELSRLIFQLSEASKSINKVQAYGSFKQCNEEG